MDSSNDKNLLVIDDEQEILKSLQRQFRKRYKVYIAENADIAYELLREQAVQVIISDQRMPGITGTQFYKKIAGEYPDPVRLILTGYTDIDAIISAINDGNIFRYVTKPWNPVELNTTVREAFERYWLTVHNRQLMRQLQNHNQELEKKVAERTRELQQGNRELQQLNEQKNQFLGMVVHDLRNPIGVVKMYTEFLLGEPFGEMASESLELLRVMNYSSESMMQILNDLLDISAIESGNLVLHKEKHDLLQCIQHNVGINRIFAEKKGISIVVEASTTIPKFVFDRRKIEQVLNNLLSNAIKYSHPGTKITIAVSRENDMAVVKVIDQGQGIPKEDQQRIFHPFQTTRIRGTDGEVSTGLGLTIVNKIITGHQGKIEVQSEIDRGTTFTFTLPLFAESKQ